MKTLSPSVLNFTSLIVGVLSCFVRVILKARPPSANGSALVGFVYHVLKIQRSDFMNLAQEESQILVDHAKRWLSRPAPNTDSFEGLIARRNSSTSRRLMPGRSAGGCFRLGSELPPRIIDGIPDPDATNDAPRPRGPFYSNWGPLDGPILARDESPALGVVFALAADWSIEIACPVGLVDHRRGPAMTSRLALKNVHWKGDGSASAGSSSRSTRRPSPAQADAPSIGSTARTARTASASRARPRPRRGIAPSRRLRCWGC